jgi:hypothetical protein
MLTYRNDYVMKWNNTSDGAVPVRNSIGTMRCTARAVARNVAALTFRTSSVLPADNRSLSSLICCLLYRHDGTSHRRAQHSWLC